MFSSQLILKSGLLLVLCLYGLIPVAQAKDLSALQTAVQIARNEMEKARMERDADAQRLSAAEKEMEMLKKQLEAERKKAAQSESTYLESKQKYDKAQTALDKAWKQ